MKESIGLSIILTYYKGEKYIFNCLDSLLLSYNKSDRKLQKEIIIVVDSPEDADHIIKLLNEKYIYDNVLIIKNEKNVGVATSRNVGLLKSKYNFYTIIDQDDMVAESYFTILEKSLGNHYGIHILNGCFLYEKTNNEVPIYYLSPKFDLKSLIMQTTTIYTPGTVIFNSNYINPANAFIETSHQFKGCDDWAAYLNIILTNNDVKTKYIKEKIFIYRIHENNYSNNTTEMIMSALSVLNYLKTKFTINRSVLKRAIERYKFLYALKVEQLSLGELFVKFPSYFCYHYVFSIVDKGRINRFIFRLNLIGKNATK